MTRRGIALLAYLSFLIVPVFVSAQETDGLRCASKGAEPPAWFSEPPRPPGDVYQAEARSGGCEDAEAAQTVAARVASWILLRERGPRTILEDVRVWREYRPGGRDPKLRERFTSVEQAVAQRILSRSWVHRQATRWTEQGRVEHFLIVRADTAALRSAATDELKQSLADRPQAVGQGAARSADAEPRRANVRGSGQTKTEKGASPGRPSSSVSRLYDLVGFSPGPPLKRSVLSWRADPNVDELSLDRLPQEVRLGLRLTPPESGWYAALGGRYARGQDLHVTTSGPTSDFALQDQRTFGAVLLAGAPRQLVPVYGGLRYEWYAADAGGRLQDQQTALGYLGLGYPPLTELKGVRVRNLYAQAGLVPHLASLEAGGRVVLIELPAAALHTLFRIRTSVREMGTVPRSGRLRTRDDRLFLNQLIGSVGLEVRFADRVGLFALVRLDSAELSRTSKRHAEDYAHIFRSFKPVSESATETGLRVGVRLAF